jgi:hypothetical protein
MSSQVYVREDASENKLASPPSDLSDVENFFLDISILYRSFVAARLVTRLGEAAGLSIGSCVSPRLRTDKTRNGGV